MKAQPHPDLDVSVAFYAAVDRRRVQTGLSSGVHEMGVEGTPGSFGS
jgi:hypothetical protein